MKQIIKKSFFLQKIYYKILFFKKSISKKNIPTNTYIDKSVHMVGLKNIKIGNNSIISEGSWLNVNNRINSKIGIDIGSNCYVGRRNFFNSGDIIKINNFFMSGINCSFLGSDHIFNDPVVPYIYSGTTVKNSIYIGVNVWLGANVTVIGNVHIGHGSIVGANSLVLKDIPPFSLAVGSPAKVIKRYHFGQRQWININGDNLNSDFGMPSEDEYTKMLEKYNGKPLPLLASGKDFGDLF